MEERVENVVRNDRRKEKVGWSGRANWAVVRLKIRDWAM